MQAEVFKTPPLRLGEGDPKGGGVNGGVRKVES